MFMISTNNCLNFQSNTTVYLLWLSYMFHSLFGPSSGFCIELLKTKNTTIHKIYTFCEITVVYIICMLLPLFSKGLYGSLMMDQTGTKRYR